MSYPKLRSIRWKSPAFAAAPAPIPAKAHPYMTVDQALGTAANSAMTDIVIAGYDADGDLIVRSSHMSRKDVLWLLEKAKAHALGEAG